jgi:hypothetical protein
MVCRRGEMEGWRHRCCRAPNPRRGGGAAAVSPRRGLRPFRSESFVFSVLGLLFTEPLNEEENWSALCSFRPTTGRLTTKIDRFSWKPLGLLIFSPKFQQPNFGAVFGRFYWYSRFSLNWSGPVFDLGLIFETLVRWLRDLSIKFEFHCSKKVDQTTKLSIYDKISLRQTNTSLRGK